MSEWIVKQNPDGQLEVVGELIRCKDCKWYIEPHGQCLDHDDDVLWLEDSYCSRRRGKKNERVHIPD